MRMLNLRDGVATLTADKLALQGSESAPQDRPYIQAVHPSAERLELTSLDRLLNGSIIVASGQSVCR